MEVLSPSTAMKDRNNKFYIYQAQKISYYIIVDADKNTIEIHHLSAEGKYVAVGFNPDAPFTFSIGDDCNIDVIQNNIWQ